jgi:hypothetical protein
MDHFRAGIKKAGLWLAFYRAMFLKNNELDLQKRTLSPHLFPHFFVVFA